MRRVSVITTASGNGGTTFSRELAARLGVPFHELDALFWKPDWIESSAEELRALVEPLAATDAWVIDGSYQSMLGDFVFRHADAVVWLDQPMRVWLPRLVRRTFARVIQREELWGDESRVDLSYCSSPCGTTDVDDVSTQSDWLPST